MELRKFGQAKNNGIVDLDHRNTHLGVAFLYSQMVHRASGNRINFLPRDKQSKKYIGKVAQIRRLIEICVELGTTFEKYMQVQFQELTPWLKKTRGMLYPPFNMLISDGAVKRYKEWETKNLDRYVSSKERQKATVATQLNYKKSLETSAEKFYQRLKLVGTDSVLAELTMYARLGKLTALYIFSHPLVDGNSNPFLEEQKKAVGKLLRPEEKELVYKLRKELDEKYEKEGMKGYV